MIGVLRHLVRFIDGLTDAIGGIAASLVIPLSLIMGYEVFARFLLDLPTFWAYELAYMITGAHFVLGIAYVTKMRQHIRVDFLYSQFPVRLQAAIDGIIYIFFLLPASSWISWRLGTVAYEAFLIGEVSGESTWNPLVWPLRTIVALGYTLFTLQILAEAVKSYRIIAGTNKGVA